MQNLITWYIQILISFETDVSKDEYTIQLKSEGCNNNKVTTGIQLCQTKNRDIKSFGDNMFHEPETIIVNVLI